MSEDESLKLTPFSHLIRSLEQQDGHHLYGVTLPADWLQGRTAYGGLSAALCLEANSRTFNELPPLRSAQFTFIGPATGALRIAASTLRAGKSTVFTGVDLSGEDGLATRATFCFGHSRVVDHDYVDLPIPRTGAIADYPGYFGWPGQPNFMSHFEGRLVEGTRPQTPDHPPEMLVWLRHRDPKVDAGMVSLLAMADALPPGAAILFRGPTPISTMTWSIDVLDPSFQSATGWWLVHCVAETAQAGYSAQRTTIWSPDGRPVLVARQNVAIFSRRA